MNRMMQPLAAGVMVLAIGAVAVTTSQESATPDRTAALQDFEQRVGQYAALHRRLEGRLPPLRPSTSPRSFILNRACLASAIKAARPNARQGDIFTPAASRLLREIIHAALSGHDAEAMLRELFEEHPAVEAFHPRLYDRYPEWATHEMPVILLQRLPPLPEDVEYRLIGHDLVLWDIHADLIVDILPDAIRRSTT